MRKLSADFIFPISQAPIPNGVVVVDSEGIILDVRQRKDGEEPELEIHKGIICPGFVNTHCHLELSHLKGKIATGGGLDNFIKDIETFRTTNPETIQEAIENAEREMLDNGIVAVGDISNGDASFLQKSKGRMKYHTFLEVYGFHPDKADTAFQRALNLYALLKKRPSDNTASITPHAPYSVSEALLKRIAAFALENQSILSIHNQENQDENALFLNKTGSILNRLKAFGIDTDWWQPTGKNSLPSVLPHLPSTQKTLLVHNTYTTLEDINWALSYNPNLYWCFCPNTNLYIENHLPDFHLFIDAGVRITIGTDSLASNNGLSILEELITISKHAPEIPLNTLLKWATWNGAAFLGFENVLGCIDKNKRPGLVLIQNINSPQAPLTAKTSMSVLV